MITENNIARHTMNRKQLTELYKMIDNFEADLTNAEYQQYKNAIINVKTAIHEQIIKRWHL